MKTELLANEALSFTRAAKLLALDEVVALPTETVYGLAGNAFQAEAVSKIFIAKERPSFDPLIVHISDRYLKDPKSIIPALVMDGILAPEILASADLPKIHAVMKKFWPGPLTIILPRGPKIPDAVTSSQPTVGIRCPAHAVFQAVLAKLPFPLAAPSANRFGRISPTEASHVMTELDGRIPAVVDGGSCEVGVESTIVKIDFPFQVTLLRPGKISARELSEAFQTPIKSGMTLGEEGLTSKKHSQGHSPKDSGPHLSGITPGSLDEHYAPRKPLYLLPHAFSDERTQAFIKAHQLTQHLGVLSMSGVPAIFQADPSSNIRVLSPSNNLEEIAKALFKNLRELDEDDSVINIIADLPIPHDSGLGAAIADRLKRASRNKPDLAF